MSPFIQILLREFSVDLPAMKEALEANAFKRMAKIRSSEIMEFAPYYDQAEVAEALELLRLEHGWDGQLAQSLD